MTAVAGFQRRWLREITNASTSSSTGARIASFD
jgi:hypothetical protein